MGIERVNKQLGMITRIDHLVLPYKVLTILALFVVSRGDDAIVRVDRYNPWFRRFKFCLFVLCAAPRGETLPFMMGSPAPMSSL